MKKILFIATLFISLASAAQPRIWGTGGYKIRNNAFVFLGTSGTDSVGKIDSTQVRWNKPVRVGAYTTAGAPSAANFPGYMIYNTDSSKLQFSNGSGWANIDQASGGGGGGTTYTFQNSLTESSGFVNLVGDATSPGNNYFYGTNGSGTKGFYTVGSLAFIQNGNSFGGAATLGTNDNNVLAFEVNNSEAFRVQTDKTISINTTSDATEPLFVNGAIRIGGAITATAHSGFSMLSGTSMANFGAIDVTSPFSWALQNTWTNVGATRNLHNFTANVTTNTSSTQELRFLNLGGTINNTAGTTTLRGIYYNPTLTSVTGTTHIFMENTSGDIRMGTTSGNVGVGITPSVKFHVAGISRFEDGIQVYGTGSSVPKIGVYGNVTSTSDPGALAGVSIAITNYTFTDGGSARTVSTQQGMSHILPNAISATNAVTYTDIATLYLSGEPTASTNMTITRPRTIFSAGINHVDVIAHAVVENSAGTLTLGKNGHYIFTGTTTTWTLPSLALYKGAIYYIKNAGSGDITLQRGGSDNIYDTSSVTSITIGAGTSRILVAGASFWYAE